MEQHAAEIAGEEESWQQAGGECLNVMLEEEEEEEEEENDEEEYEVMEEEEPETGENVPPSMSLASLSARLGNIHIGINAGGTKKTNTRKRRDFLGEALTVVPQEKAEERTSGLDQEIKQEADRIEDEVAREDEEDGEDEEWVPPGRKNNRVSKKRREPTGQAYSKTRTRTTRTRTAQRGAVMIDLTSSITAASKNTIRSDNGERNDNSGAAATVAGAAAKARLKRKKKQCNRLLAQAKTFARDLDWRASLDKYLLARALLQQLGSDVSSSMSAKVAKKIRRARLKLGFDADKEELREAQDAWAEKQRCEGHDTGEGCIDLLNENQNVLDADDGVNATSREPLCWDATSVQDMALLVNASAAEDAPSISPATLDATEFSIPLEHYQKLFPHQRRGVRWMWSLYKNGHGGILADDMGLGKTVQVASLLRGMISGHRHRVALVVSPLSVIPAWSRELEVWAPGLRVVVLHGMTRAQRIKAMALALRKGETVCVTTYGQVRSQIGLFTCGQGNQRQRQTKSGDASTDAGATTTTDSTTNSLRGLDVWQDSVQLALASERKESRRKRLKKRLLPKPGSGSGFQFCCVVLDEGQAVKNHRSQIALAVRRIPSRQRILLSGTPIQNNLTELWSLFDYVSQRDCGEQGAEGDAECATTEGGLDLGSLEDFNLRIGSAVEIANSADATDQEREAGRKASRALAGKIRPFLLRRTKEGVFGARENKEETAGDRKKKKIATGDAEGSEISRAGKSEEMSKITGDAAAAADAASTNIGDDESSRLSQLSRKTDLVVWLPLSRAQRDIYRLFLESEQVKLALNEHNSPLVAINVLRKVCNHPALLRGRGAQEMSALLQAHDGGVAASDAKVESEFAGAAGTLSSESAQPSPATGAVAAVTDTSLLDTSCKLQFLMRLLPELKRQGHRTLVFTSTRIMLDLVETAVRREGLSSVRLDGNVVSKERQRRVRRFNDQCEGDVMLLTIGVGGVGLTLTAASRVVLFSPDWNPTRDRQAIDRCFRIGQSKDVTAYRLVTCNTVEESVYRRAVWKTGISSAVMKSNFAKAWSSKDELKRLFTLENPDVSQFCDRVRHLRPEQQRQEEDEEEDEKAEKVRGLSVAQIGADEENMLRRLGAYGISFHELVCREPRLALGSSREELTVKNSWTQQSRVVQSHKLIQSATSVFEAPPMAPVTPLRAKDDYDVLMSKKIKKTKRPRATPNPYDFLELEAEEARPGEEEEEQIVVVEEEDYSRIEAGDGPCWDDCADDDDVWGDLEMYEETRLSDYDSPSPVATPRIRRRQAGIHTPSQYLTSEDLNLEEIVKEAVVPPKSNNSNGRLAEERSSSEEDDQDDDDATVFFSPVSRAKSTPSSNGRAVCHSHETAMRSVFPPDVICCTRCRCHATAANMIEYEKWIRDASLATTSQMELSILLDALEICDDDPELHARILVLGKIVGAHIESK